MFFRHHFTKSKVKCRYSSTRNRVTRECHTSEDVWVARALARDEIESFLVGEWYIVLNRFSDGSVENSVLKCIQKDLSFHGTWWQQCLVQLWLQLSVLIQWDICVKLWWGLWFMLCRNDTQLNYIILCLFNLITSYLFSEMMNQDQDSAAGDY